MISPELLRRYRCFGSLGDDQLRAIAMICTEESFKREAVLDKEERAAKALCLLTTGNVDLSFTIEQEDAPKSRKDLPVGEINTGEVFGVSALVAPNVFTAMARASQDGSLLKIDGAALRKLFDEDPRIGHNVMCPMAKALAERLQATRVQLAAARA
jgi:CRP-like cAMP-binding protein